MVPAPFSVRTRIVTVIALCLLQAATSGRVRADERPPLPDPGDFESHEVFAKLLAESRAATFRKILAVYDRHLEANRDDYIAALGRCRFIASVRASGEYGEAEWLADQCGDCSAELLDRFPKLVPVLQYRIEQLAPEQAIDFGEPVAASRSIAWRDVERARFLKSLALDYVSVGKTAQAIWAARTARSLDTGIDVSVILATELNAAGARREAIAELVRAGVGDKDAAYQKLNLLLELEAYEQALTLIDALSKAGVSTQPLLHARLLAGAGESDAARKKLREANPAASDRQDVLRRIFHADLARANRQRAIDSYQALRAEGFAADPLLRDRFALAWSFLSAPWHARDLLGLLAFLGLCLFVVLLPAIVVLPVHYAGLVRGARSGAPTIAVGRWSLKQLWAVLASVTLAQLMTLYLLNCDLLVELLRTGSFHVPASHPRLALARVTLATSLVGLVATAAWLRRGDYRRFVRCAWSLQKIAAVVLGCVAVVCAVEGAGVLIERALGVPAAATSPAAFGLTADDSLRAVLRAYGAWPLFALTVIVVPLSEEIVFRSVWLDSASRYLPFAAANLLQAAGFAVVHDAPARYPGLFALALLAGWLTQRTEGLTPAIALHAGVNLVTTCALCWSVNVARQGARPQPPAILKLQSAAQLKRACDRGDGDACGNLALGYARGNNGVSKNLETAASLNERACNVGVAPSCYDLARQSETRPGKQPDLEAAAAFYRKACDSDKTLGCNELATFYEHGTGLPKNLAMAARLYKQACDRGRAEACTNLAAQYDRGNAVGFDAARAAHFYQRACDEEDAVACMTLGSRYETGEGVERDLRRAAGLYRTACRRRLLSGCYNLGRLHQFGIGVEQDSVAAMRLYRLSCERRGDLACLALKHMPDAH
jgi:TPR repeat protein/membrane protease YdiL (CAAX protease family)